MVEITLSKYLWMRKLPELSIWIHLVHGSVCLRQAYNSLDVLLRLCPIRIWKNYILEELHFILFPGIVTRQKYKLIQKKTTKKQKQELLSTEYGSGFEWIFLQCDSAVCILPRVILPSVNLAIIAGYKMKVNWTEHSEANGCTAIVYASCARSLRSYSRM